MRPAIACLAGLLLFSISCKKNAKTPSQTLSGTWEIRSSMIGDTPLKTYSAGNDSLLKFTDNTYSISIKGQVIKSGTYAVVEDHSFNQQPVPEGQFTHRIDYQDSTQQKVFFQVNGDSLTFLSGRFEVDGGIKLQYHKTSN